MRHHGRVAESSRAVRVFISYSHDSRSHRIEVERLGDALEKSGFSVFLDHWVEHPPTSWPALIEREFRVADIVLCVCTPTYCERIDGDVPGGKGRGVTQEGGMVRDEGFDLKIHADRFRVVHIEGSELAIPTALGGTGTHAFRWPSREAELITALQRPTKRRRIAEALEQVFDDDIGVLNEWAREFVPLGTDLLLDFDARARRVAYEILRLGPALKQRGALASLAELANDAHRMRLDNLAEELKLGPLHRSTKTTNKGRPRSRNEYDENKALVKGRTLLTLRDSLRDLPWARLAGVALATVFCTAALVLPGLLDGSKNSVENRRCDNDTCRDGVCLEAACRMCNGSLRPSAWRYGELAPIPARTTDLTEAKILGANQKMFEPPRNDIPDLGVAVRFRSGQRGTRVDLRDQWRTEDGGWEYRTADSQRLSVQGFDDFDDYGIQVFCNEGLANIEGRVAKCKLSGERAAVLRVEPSSRMITVEALSEQAVSKGKTLVAHGGTAAPQERYVGMPYGNIIGIEYQWYCHDSS